MKYERLQRLPNVTIIEDRHVLQQRSFPRHHDRLEGMKKSWSWAAEKGEHSLAFAAADAGKYCFGIDLKSDRLCLGAEMALAMGVSNVDIQRARIEHVGDLLPENFFHEIWLPFPDPHLKNRSVKFRLSGAPFLNLYSRILVSGGRVHLKTDSDLFFSFSVASVTRRGGKMIKATGDLQLDDPLMGGVPGVVAAYEQDARSKGMKINYAVFTL